MIIDKIDNLAQYGPLGIPSDKIMEFIGRAQKTDLREGRHDILGDSLFALVQKYDTRDDSVCYPESHEKYADLQFILRGRERLTWNFTDRLSVKQDNRPDSDILFYHRDSPQADVLLEAGMFALLYPDDAHMPCLHAGECSRVYKIVFKIRL